MFARRLLLVSVAATALASCATVEIGRPFDVNAFTAQVRHGTSTREDVRAWLGEPVSQGIALEANGERYDEWTYYYAAGRLPGLRDADVRILQIRFDPNGVIRSYSWSRSK